MKKRQKLTSAELSLVRLTVGRSGHGRYADYRYGVEQKKPPHDPIFRGRERRSVVAYVKRVMRDWKLTPFENEGACRAGLRAGLCLQGHSWQRADDEAASLVSEALHGMRAVRPSWLMGQPEYVVPRENCQKCGGPLDDQDRGNHRQFCSDECSGAAKQYRADFHIWLWRNAASTAAYHAKREKPPERECEWCFKSFQWKRRDARFCSKKCTAEWIKARDRAANKAKRQPKQCAECGEEFTPAARSTQEFCGKRCYLRSYQRKARESAFACEEVKKAA